MSTEPSRDIETFPNPRPGREYLIDFECPEFTCVCPKTGQPDFARFRIQYIPAGRCLEMKSLKLYLWSFRNEGHFHEAVTNRILDDLVAACAPRWMRLTGHFNVRGGIRPIIVAEHPALGSAPANIDALAVERTGDA
ncbi:MAG: preQ(1) synthase [Planctomycetes bacterium]|nr:preQ(1) synthase [Planctomycetota bacterium]